MNKTKPDTLAEHIRGLSAYNERGEEIPDPTPIEVPLGFKAPIPLSEEIRRMVQNEAIQAELNAAGLETFEEADDFNIPDEDMSAPFEENFDPHFTFDKEAAMRAGVVKHLSQEDIDNAKRAIAEWEKSKLNDRSGAQTARTGNGSSSKSAARKSKMDNVRSERNPDEDPEDDA